MKKVAIVFWSGTGNTEAMAKLVEQGVQKAGGEAKLYTAAEFTPAEAAQYSAIAMGCPAMGAEVLEETEFQPMYDNVRSALSGKSLGLFGSYGWGDGQWMRDWAEDAEGAGAAIVNEPVMVCGAPEGSDADACVALGEALAN